MSRRRPIPPATDPPDRAGVLAILASFAFLALTLWNLDRFPPMHGDEPWILSPGYKLLTKGVYGSDLYAGCLGMERHYLEFMPLMSLLEGVAVSVLGLGVWQMRVVAAVLGASTLLLSFHLARQTAGSLGGVLTLLLLLFWQWRRGDDYLTSGIPLVDISRVARYDVLTAPLGLGAMLCFLRARRGGARAYDFLAGILAGLAGLAHLYGLFWIPALLTLLLLDRICFSRGTVRWSACLLLAGAFAAWVPWLAFVAANWSQFVQQAILNRDRFDLFSLSFYAHNLWNEASRYHLELWSPRTLGRPGFWLLVLGLPAAILWLSRRVVRQRDRQALALLVPTVLLPSLFAVFVKPKSGYYVVSFVPLFAVAIASLLAWHLKSPEPPRRIGAQTILALMVIQGGCSVARMQATASRTASPAETFREVRRLVPPSSRVLGVHELWLALADRDYRALEVINCMSRLGDRLPFDEAFKKVSPDFVVVRHKRLLGQGPFHDALLRFMNERRATLIKELPVSNGGPLLVYAGPLLVYRIDRETSPASSPPPTRPR